MNKFLLTSFVFFLFFNWVNGQECKGPGNSAGCCTLANGSTVKACKFDCDAIGGAFDNAVGQCSDAERLPVEFIFFSAHQKEKFIILNWATASEINNAFFSVEYSRDGIGYKEIGRVAGHGNSVETIDYEFMHEMPLVGDNFYRLRQQDFDGTFEYSEVAHIQLQGGQSISIRPNLVHGELTVVVSKGYENDSQATIYDLVGSVVMTLKFPANTASQTFDLGDLPNGHYLFHLQDGITSHVGRFVKASNY